MTAAEIDKGAVDRLLTVLGEHGRIERDLARRAIIAALPAPASGGAVWTEGVCGDGAAILRDGVPVTISELLSILNASPASGGAVRGEIEEGAWDAAWQAFRSMCRHGYIPDKTDLGVALRAYIAALPAPASGEIDEGAVEKAYRAYMDFVTDATTNDRGWTFRQAVRAMLLAALPAPASGAAEMRAEVQRLRSLLEYRDEFIVSQGLWQTFVDGLPRALPLTEHRTKGEN